MQPLLIPTAASLPSHITSVLEINTKAIASNYKTLQSMLPNSLCAAVLKADAYGFGTKAVAPLLLEEGCQHFFVAFLEEGLFLRNLLKTSFIYVLSGILPQTTNLFIENSLTPILNDFPSLEAWSREAQKLGKKLPCALHIDTGMHRNGFDRHDLTKLLSNMDLLKALDVHFIMSHLVSSHNSQDAINETQRKLFEDFRAHFPQAKASLADTGGIYLGSQFHYDIARPGKGLFGLYSPPKGAPQLQPCLKALGRILQIRNAHKGESVGYEATHILKRDSKLAVLGIGFADGYNRRLSNKAYVEIEGFKAPVLGRISMDYTVIDITDIPESFCYVGSWVDLINETLTLDQLASSIDIISRELSTGFGQRFHRIYR